MFSSASGASTACRAVSKFSTTIFLRLPRARHRQRVARLDAAGPDEGDVLTDQRRP